MSVTTAIPAENKQIQQRFNGPITRTMLDLRLEQVNQQRQSDENTRRINELHDALSINASKLGLLAEDFSKSALNKPAKLTSLPKSDSLGKRIKSSLKNLGQKLLSFVKNKKSNDPASELKPFLNTIDAAMHDADEGDTFADYFFGNSALKMTIHYPEKNEYPELYKMSLEDALEEDPKLELDSEATVHMMMRFATIASDFLYEPKHFNFNEDDLKFQEVYKTTARYLDMAFVDENFKKTISQSKEAFKSVVPALVFSAMKLARSKNLQGKELKDKVLEYALKLDKYFGDVIKEVYMDDQAGVKTPAEKALNYFRPEYDPDDKDLIMLSQVEDFLSEAQTSPSAEQNLLTFLKARPDLIKKLDDDVVALTHLMMESFTGLKLNGELNIFRKNGDGDAGRDVIENQAGSGFERKFADIAEIIYSMISHKPISRAQSKRLVEWSLSEERVAKEQRTNLKIDAERFIAKPQDSALRREFFANKQKIIFMYLMDSLNFDSKGQVNGIEREDLTNLINAVRKIKG